MVVVDELYTLALFCGRTCQYPYPWTPPLDPYPALEWAYGLIFIFWFLSMVAFHKVLINGNNKTA